MSARLSSASLCRCATTGTPAYEVGAASASSGALMVGAARVGEPSSHFGPSLLSTVWIPPLLDCNKDLLRIGVVLALVLILYAEGMEGQLTFDDHLALSDNRDTYANSHTTLWDLFQHDYWGSKLGAITSNRSFRPLTVMTFRLQHWVSGFDHCASSLRTVNVFISLLNGVCVYVLARLYLLEFPCSGGIRQWSPLLTMLLFLCHPVHVDAVVSIVGRAELLSCFFGFCAFFCVHHFLVQHSFLVRSNDWHMKSNGGNEKKMEKHNVLFSMCLFVMIVFFLLLSVLSKDGGIAFAALFILHAAFTYHRRWTPACRAIMTCGFAIFLIVGYVFLRHKYVGAVDLASSRLIRRTENPQYFAPSGLLSWWGFRWVIQVKNMVLLFFPTELCCEYSYNCIPPIDSLYDARLPFMAAVTAAAMALSGKYACRFFRDGDGFSLTCLAACGWLVIPYAPVSHLFLRVGTFIAERCLYVPSVGSVLLIVHTLTGVGAPQPTRRWGAGSLVRVAVILALALFWARVAHLRISDWHDDVSLFRSAVRVCPGSGKAHFLLGTAMLRRDGNRFSPAVVKLLKKAYTLDREYKEPLFFIGIHAYIIERNISKALALLRECTASPFTMQQCYPLFNEVRAKAFPDMKRWQMLEDNAALAPTMEEKAVQYHLAGLTLQREERDPCAGSKYFHSAMMMWNASGLYWFEDRIDWQTETSFCYTLGLYTQSSAECIALLSMADRASAVVRMAAFLERAIVHCDENWDTVPTSEFQSYMHRPSTFSVVAKSIYLILTERVISIVSGDRNALRVVHHAAVTIAARHYCYLSLFVESEVGKRMRAVSDDVMHLHHYFHRERTMIFRRVLTSVAWLQSSADDTDDLSTLLKCTAALSTPFTPP